MIWAIGALLIALNIADWLTTRRIIALGGHEKNPAMDAVLRRWGFTGLAVAKILLVGPAVLAALIWPALWPVPALLCAAYGWVVLSNVRVVRRLER